MHFIFAALCEGLLYHPYLRDVRLTWQYDAIKSFTARPADIAVDVECWIPRRNRGVGLLNLLHSVDVVGVRRPG